MQKFLFNLIIIATLFILPTVAKADTVYSSFGPGNTYQTNIGWTVGDQSQVAPDFGDFMDPAAAFTPTANYNLTSVQAAISLYSGTNSVELLLTNSINNLPGSTLETFTFTNQMGALGQDNTPLLADSVNNPELIAGDQYWLVAKALDPSTTAAWNFSNTDALMVDSYDSGNTWFNLDAYYPNQGAFQINGDPVTSAVPEPSSVYLLMIGLLSIVILTSRRTSCHLIMK
jgi:hypothetical protein